MAPSLPNPIKSLLTRFLPANPAGYNATNLQGNDMAKPIPDEQLAAAGYAGVTLPVATTPAC